MKRTAPRAGSGAFHAPYSLRTPRGDFAVLLPEHAKKLRPSIRRLESIVGAKGGQRTDLLALGGDQIVAFPDGWAGYDELTLTNPPVELTEFTYIISLHQLTTTWHAQVQADGGDIRVIDGSNSQLPADLIEYNAGTDSGLLAVKFSPDDNGTQKLRIWAGSLSVETFPADDTTYGAHSAYSPHVVAFYPFGGGADRTSNDYDLTATGSPTVGGAAGPIEGSKATTLSGSSQYFTAASSGPTATPLTALAVVKPTNVTAPMHLLGVYDSNSGGSTYNLLALTLRGDIGGDPVHAQTFQAGSPGAGHKDGFAANVWNHVAGAWGSGATSRRAFLDGEVGDNDGTNLTPTGIDLISLGARVRTDGFRDFFFAGDVAFATLYDDDMGDEWIAYHHEMLNAADPDQSDFYTFTGWTGAGGIPAGDDAHVVNGEVDLGLVPNSAIAATANTAILNRYFANAVTNYKPLFLPGKRYYIDDEIFVPPLNGAMVLLGAGGLTMAYTQAAGASRWAANTILTWVGPTRAEDDTKAMFRVEGALCKMQACRSRAPRCSPTASTTIRSPTTASLTASSFSISTRTRTTRENRCTGTWRSGS